MVQQANDTVRRFHGAQDVRGIERVPRSPLYEGRFGRMFRSLDPLLPDEEDLKRLAAMMREPVPNRPEDDNPDIPAGFTYFGQFVDHDVTFDPTSKLQRQNDPDALRNFRTPRFDLDSVYGVGPADSPFLYRDDGVRFLINKNQWQEDDLPRNTAEGSEPRRALIGDPRNDENIIVAQLHLAILKYHNKVVDILEGERKLSGDDLFDEARRVTRWHYQWAVVHDFVGRLIGDGVLNDILQVSSRNFIVSGGGGGQTVRKTTVKVARQFFQWKNQPFMPVEFSAAAYRFGHSQIRPTYQLNGGTPEIPIFSPSGTPSGAEDLRGFRARPVQGWVIEWRRFFEFPETGAALQRTRKINTQLAEGLMSLPDSVDRRRRSLAELNLLRGKALGLPSGQAVGKAMGLTGDLILAPEQLGLEADLTAKFGQHTPLWFYILKEAEALCAGKRLGPVGGRIVGEVLIGLLEGDPFSYLSMQPEWQPEVKYGACEVDGQTVFTVADLLRFAGVQV